MASIRITRFAGLLPTVNVKELASDHAQVAHNCLLWDGWLQPMPIWVVDQVFSYGLPKSLFKDVAKPKGYSIDIWFTNAVQNKIEPFTSSSVEGIFKSNVIPAYLATYPNGDSTQYPVYLGIPVPDITYLDIQITPMRASVYPIARTYAITLVSGNKEGPPRVFQQLGGGGTLFEGDLVTFTCRINGAQVQQYGITGVRLYRTVPGFDTSEELGNPIETGFHLVSYINVSVPFSGADAYINIVDSFDSSNIPGDLLISDQWLPPSNVPMFFGQTEGGWFVNAGSNGSGLGAAVQLSERFMSYAWPMQNTVLIPDNITGMAIFYDNVFIGTQSIPYHVSVELGEQETLNIQVRRFYNEYACVPNSMVSTNFGAMYASQDGLIALTADKDTVTSKSIASPGDEILVPYRSTFAVPVKFTNVQHAAWWNGNYYGFFNYLGQGWAYVFNQPSPSNQEFPLGQLVTIDTPNDFVTDSVATGFGLFVIFGSTIYTLPLPGYGYESTDKAIYTWRSKRFVMSGLTTFAGMKIVNSNSGNLTVTLFGYNTGSWSGSNPDFTFTRQIGHSRPFRIPHNHKCLEWEIQLVGNATVEEVHLSTSYQDLIEDTNTNVSAIA